MDEIFIVNSVAVSSVQNANMLNVKIRLRYVRLKWQKDEKMNHKFRWQKRVSVDCGGGDYIQFSDK